MIPGSYREAKELVEGIAHQIEMARGTRVWQDYTNSLKMIAQVVFTRSSSFMLELIQNAEDAGLGLERPGVFRIALDKDKVTITHNGQLFSKKDVEAICGIRSSKKPETGTLGYLGIGFKSVFKATDHPEIRSGWLHFTFDRRQWDNPDDTPWHVLPIWLKSTSQQDYYDGTEFVIPFRDPNSYEMLLEQTGTLKTGLYLFLRWLRRIEVVDEISGQIRTLESVAEDEDGITTLKLDGTEQRFKFFRRRVVPTEDVKSDRLTEEYRANVKEREICVAFALNEYGSIKPTKAGAMYGGVYSFLPLGEERSGASFPIQADFLVQPGREGIDYEARWNHWLVDEVRNLCETEVIPFFKEHARWRYQILPAFEFIKYQGQEQYEKLFGPKLVEPLSDFLQTDSCVPTSIDGWASPSQSLVLAESTYALKALEANRVLDESEMALAFGGEPGLSIAHPWVQNGWTLQIRAVDRTDLLSNSSFLEDKAAASGAADWFRRLYLWLARCPKEEIDPGDRRRKRYIGYWHYEMVLASDGYLYRGGKVRLPKLRGSEPIIRSLATQLQASDPVLHPDILAGAANDDERELLEGFLLGSAGVQAMDPKEVCRRVVLPKVLTTAPQPCASELLEYTRICQRWLGAEDIRGSGELWVVTKAGHVRAAREALLSTEFRPQPNWETHRRYLQGPSFVSPAYLQEGSHQPAYLEAWRSFFEAGGVKQSPDNGVEVFAMEYAQDKLKGRYGSIVAVDKANYGYDLEASDDTGNIVRIEVKGLTNDGEVELSANETEKADKYRDMYCVCVVCSIPEDPAMYLVRDPAAPGVGKKDKLRLPAAVWKKHRF